MSAAARQSRSQSQLGRASGQSESAGGLRIGWYLCAAEVLLSGVGLGGWDVGAVRGEKSKMRRRVVSVSRSPDAPTRDAGDVLDFDHFVERPEDAISWSGRSVGCGALTADRCRALRIMLRPVRRLFSASTCTSSSCLTGASEDRDG